MCHVCGIIDQIKTIYMYLNYLHVYIAYNYIKFKYELICTAIYVVYEATGEPYQSTRHTS